MWLFRKKNKTKLTAIQAFNIGFKAGAAKGHMTEEFQNDLLKDLVSSGDISKIFGKTRQYWGKLMVQGKLPYAQTAAGKITTKAMVNSYLTRRTEHDTTTKTRTN